MKKLASGCAGGGTPAACATGQPFRPHVGWASTAAERSEVLSLLDLGLFNAKIVLAILFRCSQLVCVLEAVSCSTSVLGCWNEEDEE